MRNKLCFGTISVRALSLLLFMSLSNTAVAGPKTLTYSITAVHLNPMFVTRQTFDHYIALTRAQFLRENGVKLNVTKLYSTDPLAQVPVSQIQKQFVKYISLARRKHWVSLKTPVLIVVNPTTDNYSYGYASHECVRLNVWSDGSTGAYGVAVAGSEEWNPTTHKSRLCYLRTVMAHELGHLLGAPHVPADRTFSVMHPNAGAIACDENRVMSFDRNSRGWIRACLTSANAYFNFVPR